MVGVVIVTHGQMARELLRAAEMILGPQKGVATVCIEPGADVDALAEEVRRQAEAYCAEMDGVLLLTDMFGGTPTNICALCLGLGQVEVITAVSLPMLMKCLGHRPHQTFENLCDLVVDGGRQGVIRVGEKLSQQGM